MENQNLNKIVKYDPTDDYKFANMALSLRTEADKLRSMAVVASNKSHASWYESMAEQVMSKRRNVVAQISPEGVNYNI